MYLCLFEDKSVPHLFPLALTRTAGDLRVGARTLIEGHIEAFPEATSVSIWTRPELADVTRQEHPDARVNELPEDGGGVLFINQRWMVRDGDLLENMKSAARPGEAARAWMQGETLVAAWHPNPPQNTLGSDLSALFDASEQTDGPILITHLWDLIADVPERTKSDIEQLGGLGEHPGMVQPGALLVHPEHIHIARSAVIRPGAVLNAEDGAIHIAAGATVEENALMRGPVFLGEKSVIKAGARIDGSAIGSGCKVGGEVHESIFHSYSNKAHGGYLGNSYLGRWCNLGAGTNTSNLKNDYGEVSVFDAVADGFLPSGRQFAGLFMADHSKCSINTMFNTGTVVGVFCNLFGGGFPPRHIPSFSWGESDVTYQLDKAIRVAETVMARRGIALTEADRALLSSIFDGGR